jgi:hypothetical protein
MIMSFFTPDIFVGIAFDAGGVASGPMTATFILAFTQGIAAGVPGADPLLDGFGVIALVALAPLITLQLLGLISIIQANKRKKSQLVLHEGLAAEGKQAIDTLASDDKSADVERRELIRSLGHEETLASFEVDEHDRNE